MTTVIPSIGLKGIEGYKVQVEIQLLPGVEGVSIVGLPDASVKESKDRVMAALYANGCVVPDKKNVINLSPAEQKKNSPIFDLAMAIGIMKEAGDIKDVIPNDAAFLGVLSLDGTIKEVNGILPAILAAKSEGIKVLYLPMIDDFPLQHLELRFVHTLQGVIESFSGQLSAFSTTSRELYNNQTVAPITYDKDFQHVFGHKQAKRALEIAAAGGHNVLMAGPPGCGKSLLAETFSSILPTLSQNGQFEVMSLYQLSGIIESQFQLPPFRNPHHSSSAVSLIGGGSNPKPGEVSLAHRGVLFLDEMVEFPKRALGMLRQPLETGKVTISRAASTVTYPARFILLGAMNPCPCGYLGSRHFYCTCTPKQITAYSNRVSGPIQDRMDILLKLETVSLESESIKGNEASETVRNRVISTHTRQYERYGQEVCNSVVSTEDLLKNSQLDSEQQKMMKQWSSTNNWSTRVQMKVLRLARTISDLGAMDRITNDSLWEAMTLRRTGQHNKRKARVN